MNNVLRSLVTLALFCAPMAAVLVAQPIGGPPPCWPPPCIPIDGGLGFLVMAGAVLGGKKALDLRKANKRAH
jgi:hypothetical protein